MLYSKKVAFENPAENQTFIEALARQQECLDKIFTNKSITHEELMELLTKLSDAEIFFADKFSTTSDNDKEFILKKVIDNLDNIYMPGIALIYSYYLQDPYEKSNFRETFPNIHRIIKFFREFNIKDQSLGNIDNICAELAAKAKNDTTLTPTVKAYFFLRLAKLYDEIVPKKFPKSEEENNTIEESAQNKKKEIINKNHLINEFITSSKDQKIQIELEFEKDQQNTPVKLEISIDKEPKNSTNFYQNDILAISPHNDDIMWFNRLMAFFINNSKIKKTEYTRQMLLMSADCGGMDYYQVFFDSLEIIENKLHNIDQTSNATAIEIINKHLEINSWLKEWATLREKEFTHNYKNNKALCPGFEPDFFHPLKMIYNKKGNIQSYISRFKPLPQDVRNKILEQIQETVENSINKDCKTIILIPYLYDFHPAHRMISEMYMVLFKKLKDINPNYAKHLELWMYISGDGGELPSKESKEKKYIRPNRFISFAETALQSKFEDWRCFPSQLLRRSNYANYNKGIDERNLRNILNLTQDKSISGGAEVFLKIDIN